MKQGEIIKGKVKSFQANDEPFKGNYYGWLEIEGVPDRINVGYQEKNVSYFQEGNEVELLVKKIKQYKSGNNQGKDYAYCTKAPKDNGYKGGNNYVPKTSTPKTGGIRELGLRLEEMLIIDIETVRGTKHLSEHPLKKQFEDKLDWIVKRFPENENKSAEEVFDDTGGLLPFFAKVVSVSMAGYKDGEFKIHNITSENELELLEQTRSVLNSKKDYYLVGHNITNFDIPMLATRMLVNKMAPAHHFPVAGQKPWEVQVLDTNSFLKFGNNYSLSSLDLAMSALGLNTSKGGVVEGKNLSKFYWDNPKDSLKDIASYCDEDVRAVIDLVNFVKDLK